MGAHSRREFLIGAGSAGLGTIGFTTSASASSGKFAAGQRVSPIVSTETYAYADSTSYVMGVAGTDEAGYVKKGPGSDADQTFWLVEYNSGLVGWTPETNLEDATIEPIARGTRVQLKRDAAGHWTASPDSGVRKVFPRGKEGYTRSEPVARGGYTWLKIQFNTGEKAWFARRHVEVDATVFDYDDAVTPKVDATVHGDYSASSSELGTATAGTTGRIRVGPEDGPEGKLWWKIRFPDVTGWVVQPNLQRTDPVNEVIRGPNGTIVEGVPYFYQYDNRIDPGGTCGNTTVAMLLDNYGWDGTPDDLSTRFGDAQSKRPPGMTTAFDTIASEIGIDRRLEGSTTASLADLEGWLDEGKPVAVWGMFTGPGHILVVTGYEKDAWVCNDPAGDWNGQYGDRGTHYGDATSGKYIRYDESTFENAITLGGDVTVAYPVR